MKLALARVERASNMKVEGMTPLFLGDSKGCSEFTGFTNVPLRSIFVSTTTGTRYSSCWKIRSPL